MPRIARVVVEGVPYHVTQRGNARQEVFLNDADYRLYLDLLQENARLRDLAVWAYCLMPNHIHLICVPGTKYSLWRALARTHADYARYFNIQRGRCGHLWQARFFSCPLDPSHLWHAMAYVERNPVRAGLTQHPERYPWSSAAAHSNPLSRDALVQLEPWLEQYGHNRWKEVLHSSVSDEAFAERIREASLRGRPLGTESFVRMLEVQTGRRLSPRAPGRPSRRSGLPSPSDSNQMALEIGV